MRDVHPLSRGARVYLRHPTSADMDEFLALRRASSELHVPWEPSPPDDIDPYGPVAYQRFLTNADTPECQKHLVCRLGDHALVGYVGLNQIAMGPFCSCYMGYWTGAPYVRKGYAREAVTLVLERAFIQLGLHRVEANVIPDNAGSLAIVRQCGFRREGLSPRYLRIAGAWRDHERWAMTLEDWRDLGKA